VSGIVSECVFDYIAHHLIIQFTNNKFFDLKDGQSKN
jgi:hypothetical protein